MLLTPYNGGKSTTIWVGMFERKILRKILTGISQSPVVLLTGARQTGKSTIMHMIAKEINAHYETFDDIRVLSFAKNDPIGFLESQSHPLILDEVQHVPELFKSIKFIVDKDRKKNIFLLTGSANPLLLPKLSDSLAGRMEILNLWPLSQDEIFNNKNVFIDLIFNKDYKFEKSNYLEIDIFDTIIKGGYPLLQNKNPQNMDSWINSYLITLLQRDVQDLAKIEQLARLPNLLSLLATRASSLLNNSELSRSSKLPTTTLSRYIQLLHALFLINFLPSWNKNFGKKLVKSPKIFLNDTAIICYLLKVDKNRLIKDRNLFGHLLENFMVMEICKQLTWSNTRAEMYHFRTKSNQEVDILLESSSGDIVGIEIKASNTINPDDFKGLYALEEYTKPRFLRGFVLYLGEKIMYFKNNMIAIPINYLWN